MRKFFSRLLLVIAAISAMPVLVRAQQLPPVPVDTAVRIGRLDNGLTYYIRHNDYPKGQADYFIAQKVGSILEDDNQRGLAHFLEHMCFNGTKSFPGNEMISWLESVGVKFGRNLNAYTFIDRTVYNISQVPTARESVQDSCLLVLHDWANDLLLADEEIDKERKVIHEEWRSRNVGQQRILEQILPTLYPDSKYGHRLPIGTMEVVDNFPYQALRDYYEKWYRPDLQGIIVVGDIDVDRIEGKIKEIFADIEMPADAAERVYLPVADNEATIYAIGKDKEQSNSMVQLMFKRDDTPDSLKNVLGYMVEQYVTGIVSAMLNNRLSDIMSTPDSPFAVAQASDGNYLISKTKDAFSLVAIGKGNDIRPSLEAIYREALRAKRGGFTATEYTRARSEYLSRLEKAYKNRNQRSSTALAKEYVENFLEGEPIPGIENEYSIMSMLANQIPVEAINMALKEMITDNNTVVMALLPDKPETVIPTEADLAAVMTSVAAENIEPYVDNVKSEPLITNLPQPGKIVSTTDDTTFGATVWTLSNGIKVYVKPTKFKDDEVLFNAIAKGGTSVYPENDDLNLRFLPLAMMQHGLGQYSSTDIDKYLAGKQASATWSLNTYFRTLGGSSTVKDLPTLMELIYMNFVDFTISAEEFESTQNIYSGIYHNQEANPQYIFTKLLQEDMRTSPRQYSIDVATIEGADRGRILEIIKDQTDNAADFVFYFVGNIDLDTFKPLVEQYIATLPVSADVTTEITLSGIGIKPGSSTNIETAKMDTPQSFAAVIVSASMPFNSKDQKVASIAGQILSARLIKIVREDEGAVYSIQAQCDLSRVADLNTVLMSLFPLKPEMRDKVLQIIADQIHDMTANISAEELNKVKEYMAKDAKESLEKNSAWLSAMSNYYLVPVDAFQNASADIDAVTADDVKKFMKRLLDQNNYRVFVLDPEQ